MSAEAERRQSPAISPIADRGTTARSRLRAVAREPLVHFLLIGAALFALYRFTGGATADPGGRIVISSGEVDRLALAFTRLWMRPPAAEELRGLIDKEIREEVYSREAAAMGLDRNDEIIRRRLQQKLEFLSEDVGARQTPSEADLQAYLARHSDRFRTDASLSFRQVYVGGQRTAEAARAEAGRLLARLRSAGPRADIERLGDQLSLPSDYQAAAAADVARDFGSAFATALLSLPAGSWEGPVASGYGLHLVLLTRREPGRLPPLSEIREAVSNEWQAERRREANEKFYDALRAKYTVTVDLSAWAGAAATKSGSAR